MSRSKIIILAAAAVVLLALGTAVFYFGFIYDAAKPLSYISPGDTSKEEKHLSPNEGQQAEPKPEIEIFDPAYFIPELGRTYKYTFTDDGVYKEYSDYPSFYFFSENTYELIGGKLVIPQEMHGWYDSEYLVTDYEGEYVFMQECSIGEKWEYSFCEPAYESNEWSSGYTGYERIGEFIGIDQVVIKGERHPAFHIRANTTLLDEEQTVIAQERTDYWIVKGYGLVRSLLVSGADESETILDGYEGFAE